MTDIPALIQRARELADLFESRGDEVPPDTAFHTGRACVMLRTLCTELEAERKRRLGPKDERWK